MSQVETTLSPIFYHPGGKITAEPKAKDEPAGFYFWDETWAYYHGPHDTRVQAEEMLCHYCKEVLD